jgi:hypothetical protein
MPYQWQRQTIAETFTRIGQHPDQPWVAVGDFVDDWHRSAVEDRLELVEMGIEDEEIDMASRRWAAFCAAMVEWLCWQDGLPFPAWTNNARYHLPDPWFLYPGDLLRAWQLTATPTPFKMRNIFGGDAILSRV